MAGLVPRLQPCQPCSVDPSSLGLSFGKVPFVDV